MEKSVIKTLDNFKLWHDFLDSFVVNLYKVKVLNSRGNINDFESDNVYR